MKVSEWQNFQNSCQGVVYYGIWGCQNLWYWNGGTLNIKQNLKKGAFYLGPK